MKKIKISLSTKIYEILIGKNTYSRLVSEISKKKLNNNIAVIVDENVQKFHPDYVKKIFANYESKVKYYILKSGENSKSSKELNKIYSFLIKNEFGRDSLIVAIGGGVTGDLAGYAAATYMRGIQLIHIPTTLLAAVDSSIGGKTGINFEKKKNLVGSFYQPDLVLIDTSFLATLPPKEMTSGIGEIIKYAFLGDESFFSFVNENLEKIYDKNEKILKEIIYLSALIKSSVVSEDEKELWVRKILNLGHTFGHAIESFLNFKIKHGEAVIIGLICALYLSNKIGVINNKELNEYLMLPRKVNLPIIGSSINSEKIYDLMKLDKKSRNGKINFILTSGIGKTLINVEAGKADIFYAIEKAKKLIS